MMPICVAATLGSAYIGGPFWLTFLFALFSALTMLLYLGAYLYCLVTDRDALRSEKYSIQKLTIEKGFVGDSLVGAFPANTQVPPALLAEQSGPAEEDDR
jgi:hypothetical protein